MHKLGQKIIFYRKNRLIFMPMINGFPKYFPNKKMGMQECSAYPLLESKCEVQPTSGDFDKEGLSADDLRQRLTIALNVWQLTHANSAPIGMGAIDAADENLFGFHPLTHDVGIHADIDPDKVGG
jgi:hypothetical protein